MSGAEVPAGHMIAGCVVERPLGRGGMSTVYLARRQADGRAVVVKVMSDEVASDDAQRARLLRDKTAQRKTPPHENVVQVLDVVEEQGAIVLVLEYADGCSLFELVRRRGGRLPVQEAVLVARDVARGLAAIHAQGLVHRDVKPENVMVSPAGVAKLNDFDLAKDAFLSGLTAPGQLRGTSYYLAPEQWEDAEPSAQGDLFALGATLYHTLTGRPPFVGGNLAETFDLLEAGEYPAVRDALPDAPDDLERVVAHLLEPDPALRCASAEECARDLDRVLMGRPVHLPCLLVAVPGQPERRAVLVPGTRWLLGRDAACDLAVEHPTVSRKHAELRRDGRGFLLCDLKSSHGTFVGDARLEQPRLLQDGDAVRLGDVVARFRDPRRQARAFVADVARVPTPGPVVELLLRRRDPRAVLVALERLAPDPARADRTERRLAAVVGPEVARAARRRLDEDDARTRAAVPTFLAAVAGVDHGADPAAWLRWWSLARTSYPAQVVASTAGGPGLRLEVEAGRAAPAALRLADHGVVYLGRDEKCHVRLESSRVARLHATLLRLDRRFVVLDGGHPEGVLLGERRVDAAFVAPGDALTLGDVRLALRDDEPPGDPLEVDEATFAALVALEHPAAAQALADRARRAEGPGWAAAVAALFPDDAAAREAGAQLAALLGDRAGRARAVLARLLGADAAGEGLASLLAARQAALPPQVRPEEVWPGA